MRVDLQMAVRRFASREVVPFAESFDRDQRLPPELIRKMARQGHLAALVPSEYGGEPIDFMSFGLLNEELGRACSSVRSWVMVQSMVSYALSRWGDRVQRERWLPLLAKGEAIGAFALTEPNVGSDAGAIETAAEPIKSGYALKGQKRWISFGQIADVFLVFAKLSGQACAFLVGLTLDQRRPDRWTLKRMLMSCRVMSRGVRAIMLHHVQRLANQAGAPLFADFVPTDRNRSMYTTYKFARFVERERDASCGQVLESTMTEVPPVPAFMDVQVRGR